MNVLAWAGATIVALNVAVLGLAVVRYFRHEDTIAEADVRWRRRMARKARRDERAKAREWVEYTKRSAAARRRIAR